MNGPSWPPYLALLLNLSLYSSSAVVDEISSGSQSGTSITIIGGVAGVLVFLLLLIVTVVIVVLIYKAVKQKNNSPYFMNDIAR